MKKLLVSSLLFIMGLLTFVQAADKTTIEVACYPPFGEGFQQLLPNFYREYPNIEVDLKVAGYGDHHNMLVNTIVSGQGAPDAAVIEIGYISFFVMGGGLEDLYKQPYEAKRLKRKIAPYKWAQATTDKGQLIAFPLDIAPGCAYWRRDIFAETNINIDSIKTMNDLYVVAGKITQDRDGDGKTDIWFTSDAQNIAWMILRSKPILIIEDYEIIWNEKLIKNAFLWAQKFHKAGYAAGIQTWSKEWYDAFKQGSIAYEPTGAWLGGHLQKWMAPNTAGKWGVARWPALKNGEQPMAGNWGGSFIAIPYTSKYKKEAWNFIKYVCTNKKAQLMLYNNQDLFPSYIPAWNDPIFEESIDFFHGQKARKLWIDIAKDTPLIITSRCDCFAQAVIGSELNAVINEGKNTNEAFKAIESQVYIDRKPYEGRKKRNKNYSF